MILPRVVAVGGQRSRVTAIAPDSVVAGATELTIASGVIPRNAPAGTLLRLRAWGTLTNTSGGSINVSAWRVRVDSTAAIASGALGMANSATPYRWVLDLTALVRSATLLSIGAQVEVSNGSAGFGTPQGGVSSIGSVEQAVDLAAAAVTVGATVQWASATAGTAAHSFGGTSELLRP